MSHKCHQNITILHFKNKQQKGLNAFEGHKYTIILIQSQGNDIGF